MAVAVAVPPSLRLWRTKAVAVCSWFMARAGQDGERLVGKSVKSVKSESG